MSDPMKNIKVFEGGRPVQVAAGELAERIKEIIYEYSGQIPVAAALGVLEIVKIEIIQNEQRGQ